MPEFVKDNNFYKLLHDQLVDAFGKEFVDLYERQVAARALRRAAHALNGSDPSIDPVVEWLLDRSEKMLEN